MEKIVLVYLLACRKIVKLLNNNETYGKSCVLDLSKI